MVFVGVAAIRHNGSGYKRLAALGSEYLLTKTRFSMFAEQRPLSSSIAEIIHKRFL